MGAAYSGLAGAAATRRALLAPTLALAPASLRAGSRAARGAVEKRVRRAMRLDREGSAAIMPSDWQGARHVLNEELGAVAGKHAAG